MASSPQPGEKRKVEDISSDAPLDNIVDIDDLGGDLVLVVGANLVGSNSTLFSVEKTVAFRVDYKTLSRKSSVFRAMFDNKSDNYKPGTSKVGWTEHLPDASPAGLKFLFLVAHYAGFSRVPNKQSLQEVYEIVEMASKYNLFSLLEGRARSWVHDGMSLNQAPLGSPVIQSASGSELAKRLSIAYGLGNRNLASESIKHIIRSSYIENGNLVVNGENLERLQFSLAHNIPLWKRERLRVLTSMRQDLHDFMQELMGLKAFGTYKKCPHHLSQNVEDEVCRSVALGTLQIALAKRGEWPLPEAGNTDTWTIFDIKTAWCAFKIRGLSDGIQKRYRKYECDWAAGLQQRLNIAAMVAIKFADAMEAEMKERAAWVGLGNLN
ncbi:hypothetical protein PG985_011601 [Apiospora marii]|uniref:BTB domain-containing protein n=1 Tax=Apiospora marii TaxID=335849 RepID=A0ABR1R0R5_9PEZI